MYVAPCSLVGVRGFCVRWCWLLCRALVPAAPWYWCGLAVESMFAGFLL